MARDRMAASGERLLDLDVPSTARPTGITTSFATVTKTHRNDRLQ
jgi:hypothetical protein